MGLVNQIVDSLLNGSGVVLTDGLIVTVSANDTVTRADPGAAATARAVGVAQMSGSVANGRRTNVVLFGVARVRLITGLTPAAGDTVWVSATPGLGSNVAPGANAFPVGTIRSALGYSVSNPFVVVEVGVFGVTGGSGSGGEVIQIAADDMRPPTTAGWYTLGIAPLDDDYGDQESALPTRNFPYSAGGYSNVSSPPTMLGAGTPVMEVPSTATTLALTFWVRNSYAAAAANARIRLAYLQNPNGSAHGAWATTDFADIALPANSSLVRVTYTITLAVLGTPIVAGSLYAFQFARIAPVGADLTNDFGIVLAKFSWS